MFGRFLLGASALLLFLSRRDVATEAHLLGNSKCTWGPSYWCSGLPQSAKCSSTQHCIDRVWTANPYPSDDDEVCRICKQMVKQARDQLESNETQTEIKEVFEGSCRLIPIKIVAEECVKLSDQFIVELIEMLASEMDPDTVCTVSGLCNSGRIDRLIEEHNLQQGGVRTICDVCHEEKQKLSLKMRLMSREEFLDKGLHVCDQAPSYKDACRLLLHDFNTFYKNISPLDVVCASDISCSEGVYPPLEGGEDIECEFCEKVIQHWLDEWKSNSSMEEFKQVLETFCHKLGQPDRINRCLHIVDDYYIPVFKYILNILNPKEACTAAGLCRPIIEVDSSAPIPVVSTHDALLEQEQLLGSEDLDETKLIGGYFAPQSVVAMSTPGCTICEFVLYRLTEWLQDERTQDEIERELNAICSAMPSSLEEQCENFIGTYGPAVVKLIIDGADPKQVCSLLLLCPSENQPGLQLLSLGGSDNPIAQMKRKDDNCATCQYVLTIVEEAMKDKDDQDEIRNVLDSVCTLMPSSIADRCESFVNAYAEEIIQMLADNLTPEQICEGLSLCERRAPSASQQCTICEFVINQLDSIIDDKSNEEAIKQALEQVCGYLPKTVTKECVSFVDTYTEEIIDLLTHGTSPEEVCTSIGLCDGSSNGTSSEEEDDSSSEEESEEEDGDDRPYCMLCEYAIGELDHEIEDKQNEEEIKEALDTICYRLNKPISKECVLMVNKYTDEIVEMFVKDYTPEKVCAALRLCEKVSEPEDQLSNVIMPEAEGGLQVLGDKFCGICEFGIAVVENRILNNRNMDAVERAILMMCSYLPETVADECEDLVEHYGDKIIHLIVDYEFTPREVCSELNLCSKETLWDASSVGGRRCDWGPAFWCKSKFHANACGTMEYCVRKGKLNF